VVAGSPTIHTRMGTFGLSAATPSATVRSRGGQKVPVRRYFGESLLYGCESGVQAEFVDRAEPGECLVMWQKRLTIYVVGCSPLHFQNRERATCWWREPTRWDRLAPGDYDLGSARNLCRGSRILPARSIHRDAPPDSERFPNISFLDATFHNWIYQNSLLIISTLISS